MERPFEVLGISPDADEQAVREAYRSLLKDHHPDQGGSRERFLEITDAYERLLADRRSADRDGGAIPEGADRYRLTYAPDPDAEPANQGLTVGGDYLTLSLTGLVGGVDVASLVDGPVTAAATRTVAFLRAHNTGSRPLEWRGRANTSFIGSDGFLYEGSSIVAPHTTDLPGRWTGAEITLEPGRAVDAVVVAGSIPDDVAVEQVVYTQRAPDADGDGTGDAERYLFDLRPLVRERLNRLPFERD